MLLQLESALLAAAFEMAAIVLLFWQGVDINTIYCSLLLHGLSVVAVIPALSGLARKSTGKFAVGYFLLLMTLIVLLPLVGLITVFCMLGSRFSLARLERENTYRFVPAPAFQGLKENEGYSLRVDALHEQLLGMDTPVASRLKALMAIQHMQPRYASKALHQMLGDEAEDVRLLAYGMLDRREKEIASKIECALTRYRQSGPDTPPSMQGAMARELAELHWELVYQHLVQGNMRKFCLDQVKHFSAIALQKNMQDAGLWLMVGRARMLCGDHDGAMADFTSAAALGIPHARVSSYLAELSFLRQDYRAVRRLMAYDRNRSPLQASQPLSSFWGQGGALS